MSYGLGRMMMGVEEGLDKSRELGRQRKQDERTEETHNQLSKQRELNTERTEQVIEHYGLQQRRAEEDRQRQQIIQQGLLQMEATGDPTALFDAYNTNVEDGREIVDYKQIPGEEGQPERYEVVLNNGKTLKFDREELMGLGASLIQPGALQAVRQARQQEEAEAQRVAGEREHDINKIRVEGEEDRRTEIVKSTLDNNKTGPLESKDYNAIRNTIGQIMGGTMDRFGNMTLPADNRENAARAIAIAEQAAQRGMGHGMASLLAIQVVEGELTTEKATEIAKKEMEEQGIDPKSKQGKQYLQIRAQELQARSQMAKQTAIQMGIYSDLVRSLDERQGVLTQGEQQGQPGEGGRDPVIDQYLQ